MFERLQLEVPVFGMGAAQAAVRMGASQLELNALGSYPAGGLTPALSFLEFATHLSVPLRIMIRPRGPPSEGRDFIYSKEEFAQMAETINQFKKSLLLKAERGDGFVFGILEELAGTHSHETSSSLGGMYTSQCQVDRERCADLVKLCRPFKAIFHRAFDEIVSSSDNGDILSKQRAADKALDDLSACEFDAVLTSGGLGNAVQNMDILGGVIEKASKLGVCVIIGGGVRKANIDSLLKRLRPVMLRGRTMVHSACMYKSCDEGLAEDEVQGIVTELEHYM